ncbi:hypothetical protein D3C80_1649730 [compost metagenome]
MACCRLPTLVADSTRRGSADSGGNSDEAWPAQRCGWLRYWLIASINCDSSLATAEAANTRPSDKPAKRSADEIKRMGIPFELTAPMMREVTLFRATDFPSVVGSGAIISLLH